MEWLKVTTQLIGTLAWPAVVLVIALIFRKELRTLLGAIKEVKYPGGSITVEVARLEERVGKTSLTEVRTVTALEVPSVATDLQLAIAQLRTDAERELVRLCWHLADREHSERWDVERRIDELQSDNVITSDFARSLRDFVQLSNRVIHGAEVTPEVKARLIAVGTTIVSQLHFERKVRNALGDFAGNILWHAHRHHKGKNRKFYFWSAVAASLPEFDYSYEIYRDAAERHLRRERSRGHEVAAEEFYILSLDEFVQVLEFRERELLRLSDIWHDNIGSDVWNVLEKANYWEWPQNWGDLGWQSPIIRHRLTISAVEDDLVQTRNALNRYRKQLLQGRTGADK